MSLVTTNLIGTAEAASIYGVDRSTLIRWVRTGVVQPVQKLPAATGAYLFSREEVEKSAGAQS